MQSDSLRATGPPAAGRRWTRPWSWRAVPSAWLPRGDGAPRSDAVLARHARIQARVDAARRRHEAYLYAPRIRHRPPD